MRKFEVMTDSFLLKQNLYFSNALFKKIKTIMMIKIIVIIQIQLNVNNNL
jgi:hypothetical protein